MSRALRFVDDAAARLRVERRRSIRESTFLVGSLLFANGRAITCVVLDLSATGARLGVRREWLLSPEFRLQVPRKGIDRLVRTVWCDDGVVGVMFHV
jgi:hypothetical protein